MIKEKLRITKLVALLLCLSLLLQSMAMAATTETPTPTIVGSFAYSSSPVQLSFVDRYSDGTTQPISGTSWSSSNTRVATVNSSGLVTFTKKQGPVTITAQSGSKTASISTTVPYQSIRINQSNLNYTTMPSPITLSVFGVNYDGTLETITSGVTWSASPATVASVDANGKVTFTGMNGSATITASYQGNTASVVATVNIPKTLVSMTINNNDPLEYSASPVALTVKGQYSDGTTATLTSGLTWSSNNTGVATVSSSGVVTFTGRNGTVTITATSGSVTATITATVSLSVGTIVIEGSGPFVYNATPVTLKAKDGSAVLTNAVWTSSDPTIATVSNGIVTFTGKNGTVTIYATYGDKTASISTTVNLVASSLTIKGTLVYSTSPMQLTAEVIWPDGRKQTITDAAWSSSNTAVATISSSGLVTFTGNNGGLTIHVSYANKTASLYANIVNPNQLTNLRIDQELFYSETPITLTLTGTLTNGTAKSIPASSAVWSSSDTTIATVNNGVVTYTGKNGSLTITATYNNKAATRYAYINSSIVVSSLKINDTFRYSPTPTTLALTATLKDGRTINVAASEAAWSSSDPTVAAVNELGVITFTGKNGPLTITARYGNKTATVYSYILNTVSSIRINGSLQYSSNPVVLTVTATLKNGTTTAISNASWSSSNTSVAIVNNGVVTFTGMNGYVTITASYAGKKATLSTNVVASAGRNPFNSTIINNAAIEAKILEKIRTTSPVSSYKDTIYHWASRDIRIAKRLEFITGYPDGTFKPDNNVTRGEFVVMISRIFDIPPGYYTSNSFKDIANHFARDYIVSLNNLGVIGGYGDRTFKPDQAITRAEAVTILAKLLDFSQIPVTSSVRFTDTTGHWAAYNISLMASIGLVSGNGDGRFAPDANTTRAEAISLLLRTLSLNTAIRSGLDTL